jgi:hypothetical protein
MTSAPVVHSAKSSSPPSGPSSRITNLPRTSPRPTLSPLPCSRTRSLAFTPSANGPRRPSKPSLASSIYTSSCSGSSTSSALSRSPRAVAPSSPSSLRVLTRSGRTLPGRLLPRSSLLTFYLHTESDPRILHSLIHRTHPCSRIRLLNSLYHLFHFLVAPYVSYQYLISLYHESYSPTNKIFVSIDPNFLCRTKSIPPIVF